MHLGQIHAKENSSSDIVHAPTTKFASFGVLYFCLQYFTTAIGSPLGSLLSDDRLTLKAVRN